MDILALTHRTPLPPNKGDRIRSYNLLSRLARDHRIWLACVDDDAVDKPTEEALSSFCHEVAAFPLSPARRYLGASRSLIANEPLTSGYFHHRKLAPQLRRWADQTAFDAVYVFSSAMAPYWESLHASHGLPAVVDFIDVDSARWTEYARYERSPRRLIYLLERRRMGAYERRLAALAHRCVLVSEAEVEVFRRLSPEHPALALENGVDAVYFARPQIYHHSGEAPRLLFLGAMDQEPNIDAVTWFADAILPWIRQELPDTEFDIIGAHPDRRVRALANRPGIHVTGWVADIRPCMWKAQVAVAPLRVAQGMQNSVVEAMAASVPVVATTLSARGLREPKGAHLSVANNPLAFAQAVVRLLKDPEASRAQAAAALKMVTRCHNWDRSAQQLGELLEAAAASRQRSQEAVR